MLGQKAVNRETADTLQPVWGQWPETRTSGTRIRCANHSSDYRKLELAKILLHFRNHCHFPTGQKRYRWRGTSYLCYVTRRTDMAVRVARAKSRENNGYQGTQGFEDRVLLLFCEWIHRQESFLKRCHSAIKKPHFFCPEYEGSRLIRNVGNL